MDSFIFIRWSLLNFLGSSLYNSPMCVKGNAMRVFISYGHDQYKTFAMRLAEDLKKAGYEVIIDYKYIKPGEAWDYAIFKRAFDSLKVDRENSVFVYIMTWHSVNIGYYDHYSMDEVLEARSSRIRVIPIMLEPVQAPPLVKRFHWIDATDVWPIEQHKDAYLRVLDELLRGLKPERIQENHRVLLENHILSKTSSLNSLGVVQKRNTVNQDFVGRQWLFEEVRQWLDKKRDDKGFTPCLWITGDAGVGKSAIAVQLQNRFPEQVQNRFPEQVVGLHMCIAEEKTASQPSYVILNLVRQLILVLPEEFVNMVFEQMDKWGDRDLFSMDAVTLFNEILKVPLNAIEPVIEQQGNTYAVVIDAVDEAGDQNNNPLASFLGQHLNELPWWLKVIITSRPVRPADRAISLLKDTVKKKEIDITSRENLDDIREYFKKRLKDLSPTDQQIERLVEKSQGVFLYARFITQDILDNKLTLNDIEAFPEGLDGIYEQFFERIEGQYEDLLRPGLEVLLASYEREAIGVDEIARVVGWRQKKTKSNFEAHLKGLFRKQGNALYPFHQSVVDWLKAPGPEEDRVEHRFSIYVEDGILKVAQWLVKQFKHYAKTKGYGEFAQRNPWGFAHIIYYLIREARILEENDDWEGAEDYWEYVERMLLDIFFLEGQARHRWGDFLADFEQAVDAHPESRPQHKRLGLLLEAMQRYSGFIHDTIRMHRHVLFQTLYNLCWWYDHPMAEQHYVEPEEGWKDAPWNAKGPKCHELMDTWLEQKIEREGNFAWLRSRRPPKTHLESPLRQVFQEDGKVRAVAYSPDGQRLAIAVGNRVSIRDLRSGEVVDLEGHKYDVSSVAWSPDGRYIASKSIVWRYDEIDYVMDDMIIWVWDVKTAKLIHPIEGQESLINRFLINRLLWSPDCQVIDNRLSHIVCNNGYVAVDELTKIKWGNVLSWSPDRKFVAGGYIDKTLRVWNAKTGELIHTLEAHDKSVESIAWSPDGRYIASGSDDETVRVWDAQKIGKLLHTLNGHEGWINSVACSPDGNFIASGSTDKTVRLWNAFTGELVWTLEGNKSSVNNVSWPQDGQFIASWAIETTVWVWKAESQKLNKILDGPPISAKCVAWSPDFQYIAFGSENETVRVWDAKNGELVWIRKVDRHLVVSIAWSPDGRYIASGSDDKTVRVWDAQRGKLISVLEGHEDWVRSVSWSPDGRVLISRDTSGRTIYWDTRTWEPVKGPEVLTRYFDFLVDLEGPYLVLKQPDGTPLAVWHTKLEHLDVKGNIIAGAEGSYLAILGLEHGRPSCPPYNADAGQAKDHGHFEITEL